MAFRREKIGELFLRDTAVENMFINEYMAIAPGDYVKVYLLAQMYADAELDITNEEIAKSLSIQVEDVLKAWSYWEGQGVIRKVMTDSENRLEYDVEFVSLKEALYGSGATVQSAESVSSMADKEIQDMLSAIEGTLGRAISGNEMTDIISWISEYHMAPEAIVYCYNYCNKRKKTNIKYVEAVLRGWSNEGLFTIEAIEKNLSEKDKKHDHYRKVFKALGFHRDPAEQEMRIMDTWFDEMGFSLAKVLEACNKTSGISNPNINYVNAILKNWHAEDSGAIVNGKRGNVTTGEINRYYEALREREEKDAEKRTREVYSKVPRIKEIEDILTASAAEMTKIIVSDRVDKQKAIDDLKSETESLKVEEAFLLTDNGFEMDHMDVHYSCNECRDTGMLETGERCQCFGEVTREKIDLILGTNQAK